MNAPKIFTRLLAGATVAGAITLTVISGSAAAQIHSRSETPASQTQRHSTGDTVDGVIVGHSTGTDSTVQSHAQASGRDFATWCWNWT
ncbi:hypothetical protein FKR81_37490 [Lentzea tibetensis]|uniref:Uncharacterized protein n=1 Tax=Lentzea tibetensis TaxID=2591470 RepID=A0A563EHG8_9PSEU|nr:hypothetical protein [Lentzea tibetensis]TWP46064.1 hypothetical protein FKR81_37490 [Lentzea tibetensis]